MIIKKEFLKENKDFVNESKSQIMVLDLKHFQYNSDVERFGYAVEVLNMINSLTWINKICSDLQSNLAIKTSIFYEILDSIFKEKSFENSQLHSYFAMQQELEQFLQIFNKLADTDRNFDLPFEVDLILLGIDLEHYFSLSEDEKATLQDNYTMLLEKIKTNEMPIEEFISQARELVSSIFELENEAFI